MTLQAKSFSEVVDSFTRTSDGLYFDNVGNLQTAAANEHRLTHDPSDNTPLGILLEEQRTNSVSNNRDLSGGGWINTASFAADAVGLDGVANTAHTITDSSGVAHEYIRRDFVVPDAATDHAVFFPVGKTSGAASFPGVSALFTGGINKTIRYTINTDTGVATKESTAQTATRITIHDLGTFWGVELIARNTGSGDTSLSARLEAAVNTDAGATWDVATTGSCVYDYGQVELNAAYSSSLILTGASATTRTSDQANSTIGSEIDPSSFSALIEARLPANPSDNDIKTFITWLGDSDKFIYIYVQGGLIRMNVTDVTNQALVFQAPLNVAAGADFKVAVGITANDFAISVDGQTAQVDASGSVPPVSIRRLGRNASGTSRAFTTIKSIREYPGRLTNAELEALSAA